MNTKINLIISFILISCLHVFGQEKHSGSPLFFDTEQSGLRSGGTIEKVQYSIVNNEQEKAVTLER